MQNKAEKEYLERWELLNAYSNCMLGNPAIAVLCDAYSKGIRSYDVEKAYRYALNTSRLFGNNEEVTPPDPFPTHWNMLTVIGVWHVCPNGWVRKPIKIVLKQELGVIPSIYDTDSGWFRPRNKTGEFQPLPKAGRLTEGYGCTESNAYQQGLVRSAQCRRYGANDGGA